MNLLLVILLMVVQVLTAIWLGSVTGTYLREHSLPLWYCVFIVPAVLAHAWVFSKVRKWLLSQIEKEGSL